MVTDREEGYVFLTTLVVMLVLFGLALAFYQWMHSETVLIKTVGQKTQLSALAESALEDGMFRWKEDYHWRAYDTKESPIWRVQYGENRYTVKTVDVRYPDRLRFEAEAFVDGASETLEREAILKSPLMYGLAANESITLNSISRISGPAYAREGFLINHPGVLDGNLLTGGVGSGNGKVLGTKYNKQSLPELDFPDPGQYKSYKTYDLDGSRVAGRGLNRVVIYHVGDLEMENVSMKESALVVKGDLTLRGFYEQEGREGLPAIYVSGILRIKTDNGSIEGLVAAGEKIEVDGKLNLKGTLFSKRIRSDGTLNVAVDHRLYLEPPVGFGPEVVRGPWE